MNVKILCLLFLLQISFEQTRPQIKLLSAGDTKCSESLGKMEYTAKFTYSQYQEIDSYFMLYYKDSSNKKRPTICKLSLSKQSGEPGPNGTVIPPNEEPTTNPISAPTTIQPDQTAETETDVDTIYEGTDKTSEEAANNGTADDSTSVEATESTSVETTESTSVETTESTELPQPENNGTDDNLELYLALLRGNIENSLGNASITGENLYNLSLDLKVIYDYKMKNQFKSLLEKINEMEIKINEFNVKNVYVPLDKSINIVLQKIKDFDFKKIYDQINNTICKTKQLILKHININKEMSELASPNALKNQLGNLKDKVEEKLNSSSLLKDLISKYTNKSLSLPNIPDLESSELGQKILGFADKVKELRKNGSSELLQKIDGFQNNIYESIVNHINEVMTKAANFTTNHLLIIQGQLDEIKALRDEYKDTNATANEIIKKTKQSMENNFKKIKDNLLNFLENQELIKPVVEQIKKAEENIKKTIKDSEVIQAFEAFLGDKMAKIEDFINNYDKETKSQLKESMYKIKDLLKNAGKGSLKDQLSNLPKLTSDLYKEIKNILKIDSLIDKLKEQINGTNFDSIKDNSKVKEIIDELKKKSNEFLNNTFLLKLIVDNADQLNSDFKKELEKIGLYDAFNKYLDTLKALPQDFSKLYSENKDKLNETLYDVIKEIKALDKNGVLDKLPKSSQDLKELLSKIKDLPEDLKQKIDENIKKAEELIAKIKEYNKKLDKDINQKLEDAGVKDAYNQYLKGIKDLGKSLTEAKEGDKKYLESLFYKLGDKLKADLEKGKQLLEELKNIKSKDDLINKVNELTNLNLIIDELKKIFDLPKRKENMEKLLKDLKSNLENLNKEELKKIEDKLDEYGLKEPFDEYIKGLKELLELIKKNGELDFEKLKQEYMNKEKLNQLLEKAKELQNKLKDIKLEDIKEELKNFTNIEPIVDEIKDMFNGTKYFELSKSAAINALEDLKVKLKELETKYENSELKDQLSPLIEKVKKALDSVDLSKSFNDISQELQKLKEKLEPIKEQLKGKIDIESIINNLKNLVLANSKADNLYDALKNSGQNVLKIISDLLSKIDSTGQLKKMLDNIDINKIGDFSILNELSQILGTLNGTNLPIDTSQFSDIYNILNQINNLKNMTEANLKNVDLTQLHQSLEPLYNAIMNLDGAEIKEKSKEAISQIEEVNKKILNAINKDVEDKKVKEKLQQYLKELEGLKTKLVNLDKDDLNLEEKINSIIEKIKTLEPDTLKQLLSQNLNSDPSKLNEIKEKLASLELVKNIENIKELVKDSKLYELLEPQQQKVMEALKKLANPESNFTGLINELKAEMNQNEILKALKDHLSDLKNLLKALDNPDNKKKLNETIYEIVDKIKNFDIEEMKKEMSDTNKELIEKLKGLTDIDESLEKIKELVKDTKLGELGNEQQNKLMENLKELKAKIESNTIIEDLKTQIAKNEILNEVKAHIKDLQNLLNSLGNLAGGELKELNSTIYDLKDKLDDKTILDEISKLPMGDKIVEQINKIKPKLEEMKELLNNLTVEDIKNKLNEIKDKIEKSKIPDSLKAHFESIKEAIKSYQNLALENMKKINETLYNIRLKAENINGTEMILLLNSSLFNFKDDFIDKIGNLTKLEEIKDKNLDKLKSLNLFKNAGGNMDIISNFNAELDKLKEKIEKEYKGPMKDQILNMVDNLKKLIDETHKLLTDKKTAEIYKKYDKLSKLIDELKSNIKGFTKTEDFTKLNTVIDKLKETLSTKNIKIVIDKIGDSIYSCDTKLNTLMDIKNDIDKIKQKYENSQVKKILDESKSEIKIFIKELKTKVNKLLEKSEYKPFSSALQELNSSLQESWKNIQEDEYVQQMKVGIDKTKEILKKIKEQTELVTLNETIYNMHAKVKNFIFNESIDKINETKNKYMEEIQKYKDIQKQSERIKFLLESRKENSKKVIEEAKKISLKISEQIKTLNVTKLNDIVDKLNKMNENIVGAINGTEVNEQANKFIKKIEEYEDTINNFPTTDEQEKYDKAVEDAKLKLLNHTPSEIVERLDRMVYSNIDTLNLTTNIIKIIVLRYQNKPEDVTPQEFNKNITELIYKEIDKINIPPEFNIKNKEILEDIKNRLQQKLSKSEIPELSKNIQQLIENLKKDLGSFKDIYEGKTLLEITDAIKKEMKEFDTTGLLDGEMSKLKNIYNKIQDVLKNSNLNKLKDIPKQIKVINDQSKKQLETFYARIKKLQGKLGSLPKSKTLNRTLTAIKNLITKLDFSKTIKLLQSVNISEINPKQEIENIKKIQNLTKQIKDIMDSSPLVNIFGQILFQNLNRKLSEKKRILQDKVGDFICKMDDVPTSDTITSDPELINSFILNNEVYDLSAESQLKIEFNNDALAQCNNDKIIEAHNHITYKSFYNIEVDRQKKRIKYKLNASYLPNYTPPPFFYLYIKTKFNHNNVQSKLNLYNLEESGQIDVDSYCIEEDRTDINNVIFNCFSYLDSVDEGNYELENMTSNYIKIENPISNNNTGSTSNSTNGYGNSYFHRSKKKHLSAGAIVGIILGSIAALAIIIGIIILATRKTQPTIYPTQSINMSTSNAMVPPESNIPVDYSKKNFDV